MWSWLAKIDPNVAFATLVGLGTWLYHKISGDNKSTTSDIIDSVISTFAQEILDRYSIDSGDVTEYLKRVRTYILDRVWTVLSKHGIKKSPAIEKLVTSSLEKWSAYVGAEVLKIRAKLLPPAKIIDGVKK